MSKESVDIKGAAGLLAAIQRVAASPPTRATEQNLLEIGEAITAWVMSEGENLPKNDLVLVSAAYSAAFVPLRAKPEGAVGVIRLIDRLVMRIIAKSMRATTEALGGGKGLHHDSPGEYTPHADGVRFADLLQSAMAHPLAGPDGRARTHLAG